MVADVRRFTSAYPEIANLPDIGVARKIYFKGL
jgi:hypothetical protein